MSDFTTIDRILEVYISDEPGEEGKYLVLRRQNGDVLVIPTGGEGGGGGGGAGTVAVKEENTTVLAAADTLQFAGASVTVTNGGSGTAVITITDATLTTEQVQDIIGGLVAASGGLLSSTYDDNANTLTVGLTAEAVQDAIAAVLTDNAVTDVVYDDNGNAVTITLMAGAVANSMLANMAEATFKMRAAGAGTGPPIDGSPAQLRTAAGLVIGTDVAPVTSPALGGVPTAPTAAVGTDTTQIATTEFANNAIEAMQGFGLLANRPVVGTVPEFYSYFAIDDRGGTPYRKLGGAWVQTGASVNGGGGFRELGRVIVPAFTTAGSAAQDVTGATFATTIPVQETAYEVDFAPTVFRMQSWGSAIRCICNISIQFSDGTGGESRGTPILYRYFPKAATDPAAPENMEVTTVSTHTFALPSPPRKRVDAGTGPYNFKLSITVTGHNSATVIQTDVVCVIAGILRAYSVAA